MVFQAFNKKTGRWVVGKTCTGKNGGSYVKWINVKQKKPSTPFKNIPIKKRG